MIIFDKNYVVNIREKERKKDKELHKYAIYKNAKKPLVFLIYAMLKHY